MNIQTVSQRVSVLCLIVAVGVQGVVGQANKEHIVDEEAIRKVLSTYVETWNKHDMVTWSKLFTEDVDYVNRAGGWWKSNRENLQGHQKIHEMLVKQGQKMDFSATLAGVTFLKPDIALVHAKTEWPGFTVSRADAKGLSTIITLVMVKRSGVWLIRSLQNTIDSSVRSHKQVLLQLKMSDESHRSLLITLL